jgi:hypothetical protein
MAFVTPCEKLAGMQPDRTRVGLSVSRTRRWIVGGARRRYLAAFGAASGAVKVWSPGAGAELLNLLATPAGLLAQGEFGSVGDVSAEGFGLFPRVGAAVAHAAVVEGP